MIFLFEKTGSVSGFSQAFEQIQTLPEVNGVMILSCDGNGYTPADIDPLIKKARLPVFGGVFPSIIFQKSIHRKGSVLVGLTQLEKVLTVPELSRSGRDYEALLEANRSETCSQGTLIVFVDGFARRVNAFIESLFMVFGLETTYIGGGAGSLSMIQKPCLFTNEGMVQDSAVLALLDAGSQIRVSHGWKILQGPFLVTESDRNRIYTLDWQPAFDVYHRVVAEHLGRDFNRDEFFDVARFHPFGINRLGGDLIVRDPIECGQDRSLICVGELSQGNFVSILQGSRASLISATAASVASKGTFSRGEWVLVMDCISRVMFLGRDFKKELSALFQEGLPMAGACSIGEIASNGGEFPEFFNKTTVFAVLDK